MINFSEWSFAAPYLGVKNKTKTQSGPQEKYVLRGVKMFGSMNRDEFVSTTTATWSIKKHTQTHHTRHVRLELYGRVPWPTSGYAKSMQGL